MNPNDPNVALVELVAARLGALRERMVFVGGCAAGLLITDPALPAIRATEDVDVVVEVATLADYHRLEKQVSLAGFQRDLRAGAPICRWRLDAAALDLISGSSLPRFSSQPSSMRFTIAAAAISS